MTNLSAEYLLIQGQSRQTANVAPCAPSPATSVLYLDQMEPRVLGQGCSPLQRPLLSSCSHCHRSQVQDDLLTPLLAKITFSPPADVLSVLSPSRRNAAQAG